MPDFDPPAIEPVVDERTPNFDLPLVSKLNNSAQTDTHRLRSAIYKVDEELGKVKTASADTATPTQAGAKRDGSNDAPAVATWLATLRDSNLRGEATGKLTLSSRVVIDLSGTSPGEHLAIFGSGLNSQTFLVKNADGGLKFNGTGVGRQHSVVLDQVGIVPGQPNSGTAFEFVGSAGGLNNNNSVTLSHVQVGPLNEADPNDFADGIIIPRGYRSQLDHVRVMKATAPGVGSANLKWNSVVDVSETYFPRITDIWGNVVAGGAIYGIKSHGTDEEDISVNGALLNGADYALSYVRDSREPGGRFNDWESNSNVCNFYIDGAKHWTIVAPYLFCKRHVSGFKDIHI
ncbi:hypothetical protein, partial [Aurantimonas sp. 22II-16-19i]|uniref:hypothetical protein n=1 Tax=Aurantimonas sp. 22II-16-19i TaxID=1317114 RepID=UPI0009F7DA35